MVLPRVLRFYLEGETDGSAIQKLFLEMAEAAGVVSRYDELSKAQIAKAAMQLVEQVEAMHNEMKLPDHVPQMKVQSALLAFRCCRTPGRVASQPWAPRALARALRSCLQTYTLPRPPNMLLTPPRTRTR